MLYFTSDQHYGHRAIITHCERPFASVEEMDEEMIARHNAVVQPGDTVVHVGDVVWYSNRAKHYFARLNGTHKLIPGNHDTCHPSHKRMRESHYRAAGIEVLDGDMMIELEPNVMARVCHFPYSGDRTEVDRYVEWRPEWHGELVLLHGHVHEKWRVRFDDKALCINVGVDVWDFAPVSALSLATIAAMLRRRMHEEGKL